MTNKTFVAAALALGASYGPATLGEGRFETLVTACFLHAGFIHLAFNMLAGTPPQQRSAPLLLEGTYGWLFWGVVVILGALVPVVMEWMDIAKHGLPLQQRLPSILKLAGRFALRVVIVFAGLLSFV